VNDPDGNEIPEDIAVILNKYGLALISETHYEDEEMLYDFEMYVAVLAEEDGSPTDVQLSHDEFTVDDLYRWLREKESELDTIIAGKKR
jgi:hypothetical protein